MHSPHVINKLTNRLVINLRSSSGWHCMDNAMLLQRTGDLKCTKATITVVQEDTQFRQFVSAHQNLYNYGSLYRPVKIYTIIKTGMLRLWTSLALFLLSFSPVFLLAHLYSSVSYANVFITLLQQLPTQSVQVLTGAFLTTTLDPDILGVLLFVTQDICQI